MTTTTTVRRSEGWRVSESFVPNGPTDPVTLLVNEQSLTQLAGVDAVAWQIPWSLFGSLHLVRSPGRTTLSAHVDGRTFTWRASARRTFDELAPFVLRAGGRVERSRGVMTGLVAAVVVGLLSTAGYLGARWESRAGLPAPVTALESVNLRLSDLPGSWTVTADPLLTNLVGPANQVYKTNYATTTTTPPANSVYAEAVSAFQHCMKITNVADRMYGAAGQAPLYQVASPTFASSENGGVEIATYAQYYPQLSMVQKDTAEMRLPRFAGCFANVSADLVEAVATNKPHVTDGVSLPDATFAKGFRHAGVASVAIASSATLTSAKAHLIVVVATSGHFETTLYVLTSRWPATRGLVDTLTNILVSHVAPSTGTAI